MCSGNYHWILPAWERNTHLWHDQATRIWTQFVFLTYKFKCSFPYSVCYLSNTIFNFSINSHSGSLIHHYILLLLNTDHLQHIEYYVRGCSTSTKYWPPSTSWILCQRLFLTSTKYWPPSTSWRLCQRLFYFY